MATARRNPHVLPVHSSRTSSHARTYATAGSAPAASATAKTTFYPLGFFESGNSISGSAVIYDDVEFRRPNYALTSTQCSDFIQTAQGTTAASCGSDSGGLGPKGMDPITDVNAPPPYVWRPSQARTALRSTPILPIGARHPHCVARPTASSAARTGLRAIFSATTLFH
jgi:hypothetical protein